MTAPMAIPPDDKDWTWVLSRPCAECGFDAVSFPRERVGAMVRDTAAAWHTLLAGDATGDATRPDRLTQRPSATVWSPLEYACHVRDVYRIYDERLELMLTRDDPLYQNWDQDASAVTDRYNEQSPATVERELAEAAARLADRFDTVSGDQWSRPGRRSDGKRFTIETFARYMIHDPIHHLHDVGYPT